MKALSLLQPWASLVVMGVKTIETRSWSTPYRGELLIHASTRKAGQALLQQEPFSRYFQHPNQLTYSALIGQVYLSDVIRMDASFLTGRAIEQVTLEERAFGHYEEGRFAWILENPLVFRTPIPVKGSLGLWNYAGPLDI
ncbi:MAG TPA: ASCH domain-containing protein [Flavisolibacter sp.]|jgi:hypothetical protein|nr:ASCH domain-containing protein [Flavisolibacter sp.]